MKKDTTISKKYYNEEYLNISCKTYPPHSDYRAFKRGGFYVLTDEYKRELITELGDSGYILFEYYHNHLTYNYFKPDDNERIAKDLAWNTKKVERLRKKLKDVGYLLVLKDTGKDGTRYYRVLMGKEIVNHYKENGTININEIEAISVNSKEQRELLAMDELALKQQRVEELEKIINSGFPTDGDYKEYKELIGS